MHEVNHTYLGKSRIYIKNDFQLKDSSYDSFHEWRDPFNACEYIYIYIYVALAVDIVGGGVIFGLVAPLSVREVVIPFDIDYFCWI